jgi:crotonobetainyl-CoA:carnitine CoA-transferase CaiB-like acyl-CoA transferase
LREAGIAAGVVQDIADLIERDLALQARGALVELPHPKLGAFGHMRTPISFSADTITPFRAPALGEHNREVALQVAGLSVDRYEALQSSGVFQ